MKYIGVILSILLLLFAIFVFIIHTPKPPPAEPVIRTGVVMDKYIIQYKTEIIEPTGGYRKLEKTTMFYVEILSRGVIYRFQVGAKDFWEYKKGRVIIWAN